MTESIGLPPVELELVEMSEKKDKNVVAKFSKNILQISKHHSFEMQRDALIYQLTKLSYTETVRNIIENIHEFSTQEVFLREVEKVHYNILVTACKTMQEAGLTTWEFLNSESQSEISQGFEYYYNNEFIGPDRAFRHYYKNVWKYENPTENLTKSTEIIDKMNNLINRSNQLVEHIKRYPSINKLWEEANAVMDSHNFSHVKVEFIKSDSVSAQTHCNRIHINKNLTPEMQRDALIFGLTNVIQWIKIDNTVGNLNMFETAEDFTTAIEKITYDALLMSSEAMIKANIHTSPSLDPRYLHALSKGYENYYNDPFGPEEKHKQRYRNWWNSQRVGLDLNQLSAAGFEPKDIPLRKRQLLGMSPQPTADGKTGE